LRVTSVSDPAHPSEVGYYATPGYAWGVAVAGNYAYVADEAGLRVVQFYGGGIEESFRPQTTSFKPVPTFARNVLVLAHGSSPSWLLDASGRKVMKLHQGANDVRALAPGVYFVRAVGRELSAVSCRKVVLTE
jgi:hypothetical protein